MKPDSHERFVEFYLFIFCKRPGKRESNFLFPPAQVGVVKRKCAMAFVFDFSKMKRIFQTQLARYGLRPMGRKRAIAMLSEIYEQTHPGEGRGVRWEVTVAVVRLKGYGKGVR